MAERVIARIDGSTPAEKDNGRGIGPVGTANAVAIGLAGIIAAIVVAILKLQGIELDPNLVSGATGALAFVLGLVFTYFTPPKKIIELVEVIVNRDVDADGTVGESTLESGTNAPIVPPADRV